MSENNMETSNKLISLDYIFGEGEQIRAFQIVRFSAKEPWLVFENGLLLSTLNKENGIWIQIGADRFQDECAVNIEKFIDQQHFNFLPGKIKTHWFEAVEEVVMQNDSLYLVVCKPDIEFSRFKNVFASFIPELVEEEWAVEFKVYNSDFEDEFMVRVF
ncbi:hypothetical protein [Pedobacter agri]|uniref:hypothetical protein n=1 Tax=Pedobacter agri TaxID=454586 RepID=UPI00292DFBC6|nr:hypothetical protein [Pedobacter agri]